MLACAWRVAKEELEKVALGVHYFEDPTLLPQGGLVGKYIARPEIDDKLPQLAQQLGMHPGQDLLAMAPKEQVMAQFPNNPAMGEAAHRMTKRHELAHYLRNKKGLMEGLGKPGLVNVARTAREEIAATAASMKPMLNNPELRAQVKPWLLPKGIAASVVSNYGNYPGGVREALTDGPVLKPIKALARKAVGLFRK